MTILNKLKSENPPTELFHYTNQKGLLGILNSKTLRTTKVHCLNDASEFVLALNLAKKILTEFEKADQFSIGKIEILRDEIESIKRLNIFISSFTEEQDQLSQWRAYGNSSGGFAIGFHGPTLYQEIKNLGFFLAKCEYDNKIQYDHVSDLLSEYLSKDFKSYGLETSKDHEKSKISFFSGTNFWKDLSSLAPILKDKGFYEEKEWRIITERAISAKEVSYRIGSSYIIPYYEFKMENPNKLITSITIGPTPHRDISEDTLQMFLRKQGLKESIIIKHTGIPYRNW